MNRKKILSLLLAVCLLAGLCACGESAEVPPATEPSPEVSETAPADVESPEEPDQAEAEPEANPETEPEAEPEPEVAPPSYIPDPSVLVIATDRHENTEIIPQLLSLMYAEGYCPGAFAHGGDAVGSGPDIESNTNYAPVVDTSVIRAEVDSALSPETQLVVLEATHDRNMTDSAEVLYKECTGIECGNFYIYTLPEDYMSTEEAAQEGSARFIQWAQGADIDPAKPIVILSHKPIHHLRNDNLGAAIWHEAINQIATNGGDEVIRSIIFSHGHNHTADSTEYYYEPGSSIAIQGFGEDGESEDIIHYAYVTSGYLNKNGSCTILKLSDGSINIIKCSLEGFTELGSLQLPG